MHALNPLSIKIWNANLVRFFIAHDYCIQTEPFKQSTTNNGVVLVVFCVCVLFVSNEYGGKSMHQRRGKNLLGPMTRLLMLLLICLVDDCQKMRELSRKSLKMA